MIYLPAGSVALVAKVEALALRTLAERLEHGEPTPELDRVFEAV